MYIKPWNYTIQIGVIVMHFNSCSSMNGMKNYVDEKTTRSSAVYSKKMTWNINSTQSQLLVCNDMMSPLRNKAPSLSIRFICILLLHNIVEELFVIRRCRRWAFARQFGRWECLNANEQPKKSKTYAMLSGLAEVSETKIEREKKTPFACNNRKPQSSAIFLKVHAHKYRLMQMLMLLFNGELFSSQPRNSLVRRNVFVHFIYLHPEL